ncbi:MAG: serine--tRNA ligase [Phycisphaera sp.]|nr:serine--tRNA ligase [Phycisphaera sp.]
MIDLKDLRENPDKYRDGMAAKNYNADLVDELLDADKALRAVIHEREQLTAEKNKLSKEVGQQIGQLSKQLKAAGDDEKARLQTQIAELKARPEAIKAREQELADKVAELTPKRDEVWVLVAQPPDPDVPRGRSAADNVELRTWNPSWFDAGKSFAENKGFDPKSHVDLMQALDLVDFDRGTKLSGARSYVLKRDGMRLHNAILRFAFDTMINDHGFVPVSAPPLVRERVLVGTAFFPHGKDDVYHIANPTSDDGLYLTGTGEAGLMALHMDEIVDVESLPLRYTTVSTCFRREAGSAGKDTAGLYRIHQFDKVEQVVICKADEAESRAWHKRMLGFVELLLQALELPYRLLQCCTADLGPKNADMVDIECWMPSRGEIGDDGVPSGAYGETHSASRLYDYQCRRLNLRYKDPETKSTVYCHSLNNTVAASPRILIPIVEMYQNADGSITVPNALRPYMNGVEKIG